MPAKVYLPAPRKYHNQPTVVDGYKFASKREAARYEVLKLRVASKEIYSLEARKKQLRWRLEVNGFLICIYEADFAYCLAAGGKLVVEDAKGMKTAAYIIKKKLMRAIHGIEITEV